MKKPILLLFSFILLFCACRKDNDTYECPPDVYYPLDSEALTKFPFTGTETLRFVHRMNGKIIDTFSYIGNGIKRDSVYGSSEKSGVGYCVRDISMEKREVSFVNNDRWDAIHLKLLGSRIGGDSWIVHNGSTYRTDIGSLDNRGWMKMIGSIQLEGKYYFDVNVLPAEGNFDGKSPKSYLLYSTTDGFLQFINKDSTEFFTRVK